MYLVHSLFFLWRCTENTEQGIKKSYYEETTEKPPLEEDFFAEQFTRIFEESAAYQQNVINSRNSESIPYAEHPREPQKNGFPEFMELHNKRPRLGLMFAQFVLENFCGKMNMIRMKVLELGLIRNTGNLAGFAFAVCGHDVTIAVHYNPETDRPHLENTEQYRDRIEQSKGTLVTHTLEYSGVPRNKLNKLREIAAEKYKDTVFDLIVAEDAESLTTYHLPQLFQHVENIAGPKTRFMYLHRYVNDYVLAMFIERWKEHGFQLIKKYRPEEFLATEYHQYRIVILEFQRIDEKNEENIENNSQYIVNRSFMIQEFGTLLNKNIANRTNLGIELPL